VDIVLSPDKTLYIVPPQECSAEDHAFIADFNRQNSGAFWLLGKAPGLRFRSASTRYWYEFFAEILRHYCTVKENLEVHPSPDGVAIAHLIASAPEFMGREHLDAALLGEWWRAAIVALDEERAQFDGPFRQFIAVAYPEWAQVGRLHFHLAETPEGSAYPFAFLATLTTRISDKARVQHRPLGSVLAEADAGLQKEFLHSILQPLGRIAEENEFIATMLSSKRLFNTAYFSSGETWQFLQSVAACERAGVLVKFPKSWADRKPSALKVALSIDAASEKSVVGINSLFGFSVAATVDGVALGPDELADLLQGEQELVALHGKWIAVDRKNLGPLLAKWRKAALLHAEGLPFSEAMRMLSGAAISKGHYGELEAAAADSRWVEVTAGKSLQQSLQSLLAPSGELSREEQALLQGQLHATLRPYQVSGVNWLRTLSRVGLGGCLADDMGLGKTLQVIALLLLEKAQQPQKPSLLILPASLLGNWQQELTRFAPSLTVCVLHPSALPRERIIALGEDFPYHIDLMITTYALVKRIPWLYEKTFNILVLDEAQTIKNPGSQQTRDIKKLQARVRLALSGTPVENRLGDLWSLFDFCCRSLLGTAQEFREFHARLRERGNYEGLRRLISPYVLRRKKTDRSVIADLPEKTEVKTYCLLTAAQIKLYSATLGELAEALKNSEEGDIKRKGMVLSYLLKFKQICNHPSQYKGDGLYDFTASGKFQRLGELAETIFATGEKLLLFTQFRELTDILDGFLASLFGRKGCVLHGGTPIAQRQKLVELFQSAAGAPYFVLSLKAGGTGLNLTNANHVIHFDRWWNPAVENQASDRAFRIGQQRNVLVHKFICRGTIEERIDQMIESKQALADQVIEGGREFALTELCDEEILKLVALDINAAAL
jgi:superfamily II DNA or RNA helicase